MVGACRRHTDGCTGLSHGRQAGTDGQLPGYEVRPASGTACLRVIVGESHAFGCKLVKMRRPARHDALVVGTDVEPADVVTHDIDDVGFLGISSFGFLTDSTDKSDCQHGCQQQNPCPTFQHVHVHPPRKNS